MVMISALLSLVLAAKPELSAWVVGYNEVSVQRFEERAKYFNTVFMEYYTITATGIPVRRPQYEKAFSKARDIAKKNGVQFFGMINNYAAEKGLDDFDPLRMSKALATSESRMGLAIRPGTAVEPM